MFKTINLISIFLIAVFFLNAGCGQISNEEIESKELPQTMESSSVLKNISFKFTDEANPYLSKAKKSYAITSITVSFLNQRTLISAMANVDMNIGSIDLELLAGDIYDFYVAAYGGLSGTDLLYSGSLQNEMISASTTQIVVSLSPQITPPPLILSSSFLHETTSKVTLSAEINPNGNYTAAYFEWWSSDSISKNKTTINNLGTLETPVIFSESINGLSSQTIYHFRVVAESSNNIVFGQEQLFTTKPNITILSWSKPITDEDGNILTDLAGYKIYRRTQTENTTTVLDVGGLTADPTTGLVTYTISSLPIGTHYFSVTAYDASGNESAPSIEASKVID